MHYHNPRILAFVFVFYSACVKTQPLVNLACFGSRLRSSGVNTGCVAFLVDYNHRYLTGVTQSATTGGVLLCGVCYCAAPPEGLAGRNAAPAVIRTELSGMSRIGGNARDVIQSASGCSNSPVEEIYRQVHDTFAHGGMRCGIRCCV